MTRKVTIREVAKLAGTSVSTVSLALRDSPKVTSETRNRIKKIAKKLGYSPNLAAQMLRLDHPKQLGILWRFGQSYHDSLASQILHYARKNGFSCLYQIDETPGTPAALSQLAEARAEALILIDPLLDVATLATWQERIPLVTIGQAIPNATWDQVVSDIQPGVIETLSYFQHHGVNELWYFGNPNSRSGKIRKLIVENATTLHGLKLKIFTAGETTGAGFNAANRILKNLKETKPARTIGFLGYNDHCALGILLALHQNGWKIGHDALLVGVDNSRLASQNGIDLSSIDRNCALQAETAIDFAISRIQERLENLIESAPKIYHLGSYLVRRS